MKNIFLFPCPDSRFCSCTPLFDTKSFAAVPMAWRWWTSREHPNPPPKNPELDGKILGSAVSNIGERPRARRRRSFFASQCLPVSRDYLTLPGLARQLRLLVSPLSICCNSFFWPIVIGVMFISSREEKVTVHWLMVYKMPCINLAGHPQNIARIVSYRLHQHDPKAGTAASSWSAVWSLRHETDGE